MSPDQDFIVGLLRALGEVHLEALVVGMAGAALQGVPAMTLDVDLLVRDTPRNREKIEALGIALGAGRPREISPLTAAVRLTGARVPVDLVFDEISGGLTFNAVRSRSVAVALGGQRARVAALEDIIASKEAAGRPKDLAQLPILRDTLRVKAALAAVEHSKAGRPCGHRRRRRTRPRPARVR
ncbi:MAG: hypothetical protein HY906_19500 [Deltaproteobacteria bacterium]|nr:hypothetical protein [Deltaproteobacteria bacterium]